MAFDWLKRLLRRRPTNDVILDAPSLLREPESTPRAAPDDTSAASGDWHAELASRVDAAAGHLAAEDYDRWYSERMEMLGMFERASKAPPAGVNFALLKDLFCEHNIETAKGADAVADRIRLDDEAAALDWWWRCAERLENAVKVCDSVDDEVSVLHQKVLGEAATASYRLGFGAQNNDDVPTALDYMSQASDICEQLFARYPAQPVWVRDLRQTTLRTLGALHKAAALAAGEADDRAGVGEHWRSAADVLERLLRLDGRQPDWIGGILQGALRNGGVAFRDVARELPESDIVARAEAWYAAAELLGRLFRHFPEQPDWVAAVYEAALREGGRTNYACWSERLDDDEALDARRRRAGKLLSALLRRSPGQPDWVRQQLEHLKAPDREVAAMDTDD